MSIQNSESLDEELIFLIKSTAEENGLHNFTYENVAVNLEKGENYLSVLKRIKVCGKDDNGEEKELNLFIKNPLADPKAREDTKSDILFQKEIFVYTRLLPTYAKLQKEVSIPVQDLIKHPKLYNVGRINKCDVIVLEDLVPEGFVMRSRFEPIDYPHARLIIQSIAKFHSLSFALQRRQPDLFSEYTSNAKDQMFTGNEKDEHKVSFQKMIKDKALSVVNDAEHKKKFASYLEDMSDKMSEAVKPQKYSVLCHGDYWTNNMLFKYEEGLPVELGFIDFQIMRYATPVTDLLYFICCCTSQDLRRIFLNELLDLYHDTLGKTLNLFSIDVEQVYPHSIFLEDFKKYSGFGISFAIVLAAIFSADVKDAPEITDLMNGAEEIKVFNSDTNGFALYAKKINELVEDCVEYGWI